MKKRFVVTTLGIMLVSIVTACGSSSSNSLRSTKAMETIPEEVFSEAEEPIEKAAETEVETETDKNTIMFDGLTVADNDEYSIEITGITTDRIWGDQLTVFLENNSADKTYMFFVESLSVDGLQISDTFSSTVTPGKKANETLEISDQSSIEVGITAPTDIEVIFEVYDNDELFGPPIARENAHVYPYGEDKATKYVREIQDTDIVVVDDDAITIIVTDYDPESIWGYAVDLYMVNKTDKDLGFITSNESINGFMMDALIVGTGTVSAGKSEFFPIVWFSSDFEKNGIKEEDVEEIEFTLRVYENNNISSGDFFNETITLNP